MSLIHWWPLNGNLNDLGLNPLTLSNSNVTFDDTGKIGKAALFDSDSDHLTATNGVAELHALMEYSMTCWVYLSDQATNHSSSFLSSGNWNSNAAQICFGLYDWSGGYSRLLVPNGSSWANGISLSTKIQLNAWHHYTIVYDGLTTKGYIDGTYVGSYNGGGISSTDVSYYYLGAATYYDGFTMKGTMNDFRIYDHALSAKEVKEISKGLVLHYNFEDEYIESTTNLSSYSNINGWNNSGTASYSQNDTSISNIPCPDCKVLSITQTTAGQSAGTFGTTSSNVPSKTLTASVWFYMSGTHTGSNNIGPYIRSNKTDRNVGSLAYNGSTSFRSWPNEQWIKLTATFTTNNEETTLYFCAYTANANEKFVFNGWQIEEKDHATPYVNGTRGGELVYDSSGYGNNGTVVGDCQIISQTNNGIHSLFNNSTNIGTSTSSGAAYIKGTLVNPWSPEQLTISFWAKIIDYRYQNSGILSLSNNSSYPDDYTQAGVHQFDSVFRFTLTETAKNLSTDSLIETSVWHHYALVYNGLSVISYRDGIKIQEVTGASGNIKLFQYIYLGLNVAGGAWRQSKENWADFKLYSTALSEADIQAEYNRKAAIDKNGNLFTGEIIETTYNLLTSENLLNGRVNTSATSNVGEIVTRNGYSAYRISPVPYWSGDGATSKNICKGQFGPGQYIFDLWIDVDEVYYDGNGQWVPGGFEVYYTDGSVDNVVVDANSTQGHSGYQHLIRKTNANKTISGLGVYYYIGVPVYIRCDSVICKVNSDGKICKNNIIAGGQFVEPAVLDSKCKLTRYGVVSNAIKEL